LTTLSEAMKMVAPSELLKAEIMARKWESLTGLSGDCFRAYALWEVLKKCIPELDGVG